MDLVNITVTVNFKEMCRLCMGKESNMLPLFVEQNNLLERIVNFIPTLKLCTEDGLPAQVCLQCVQRVRESYNFKLQCETTDVTLRQLLNFRHIEDENVVIPTVKQEPDINITIEEGPLQFNSCNEPEESDDAIKLEDVSVTNSTQKNHIAFDEKEDLKQENCMKHVETSSEAQDEVKFKRIRYPCTSHSSEHMVGRKAEKKYKCRFCERSYYFKNSLISHYKLHPDKKPFKCNKCNDNFSYRVDLKKHTETHLSVVEPGMKFVCPICGKFLGNNSKLKIHMLMHTGERPFACNICGKSYTTKKYLEIHTVIHTGERPHLCEECGARFAQASTLRVHMLTHNGGRKYICEQCGKVFRTKAKLQAHILKHTGEKSFVCKDCNKAFSRKDCLVTHIRLHTGDQPFPCPTCGKRFERKDRMKEHSWIHLGQKPYSCEHCGKGFMRIPYLKYHLSNAHDIIT